MKIEKRVALSRNKTAQQEFIDTVCKLNPGESFVLEHMPHHWRVVVTVIRYMTGKDFLVCKEGEKIRVGRAK